jgi:hypothetical protein
VLALAAAAACAGALVALHYHRIGLTLSHYDARGHLVVARRIFDSLTPGWQQIGAVWLPLPHLLNALPVQVDLFYRTGASAAAISVAAFATAVAALAGVILLVTGSRWAAIAGVAVFALNPNVLYLQATPMTEPLLIALLVLAVAMLTRWCARICDVYATVDRAGTSSKVCDPHATRESKSRAAIGAVFALACLTRYEAWPATVSALALAAWALHRAGMPGRDIVRAVTSIALLPAAAILGFAAFSRVVIGEWLVAGGFFVPENTALGHPIEALAQIGWGIRALSGRAVLAVAIVGLAALAVTALVDRRRAWLALPLALAATASVPWTAFLDGHPYRIRYMVPLIAVQALGVGTAAGLVGRVSRAAAAALLLVSVLELRPIDPTAPMVVEAQWDRPNVAVRRHVTDCLRATSEGGLVMASMGSLGHYMQELASAGFGLDAFLHEGNGDIWLAALEHPRPFAGWILIEEKAEGGDALAHIAHEKPRFLDGYARVCEGAGLALYRRE